MCLRLLHRLGDLGRDRAYCRADPVRRGPNGSVAVCRTSNILERTLLEPVRP